ncbi:hypothetical protein ACGVWS_11010 [Enterobacteriaceae bacterium LUAb1]
MRWNKNKPQEANKLLRNTIRGRFWLITGGILTGLQTLLDIFIRNNDESGYLTYQAVFAIFCIGYGLSLTPKIRKLSQTLEASAQENDKITR